MKVLLGSFILALATDPAGASAVVTEHARTELIAEADGVTPGGTLTLALAQELEAGWHVYWKNPGDSGLPLEFDWSLPNGATAGPIDYPAPQQIPVGPLVNFGHEGAPVFLTSVTASPDAVVGSTFDIALQATWLICADICVPETGSFSLSVPVVAVTSPDPTRAALFSRARDGLPKSFGGEASFFVSGKKIELRVRGAPEGADPYFFPDLSGVSEPSAEQRSMRKDGELSIEIMAGAQAAAIGDRLDGVLSIVGPDGRIAVSLSAQRVTAPVAAVDSGRSLAGLLFAAFLGGAILNLMPCVFPILFVKAATMARSASGDLSAMRRRGLLYGAGVIGSFAVLGGLLLALRAGGEEIGWGFHLQSPSVIILSAYVLFAVGLNFAGVFHIGSSLQNVGSGLFAGNDDDIAAFLTGVLAVFVAAPCVGPFLTAPVGAAAFLPPLEGMSIFVAMAAGLAAPFVALSFSPALARALPKPGPWMERFRQILSFPVFAAAAYFIWVLSAQAGQAGLALGLVGLLAVAIAARFWEWGQSAPAARVAAGLFLLLSLVPAVLTRPTDVASQKVSIAFDPADIDARRAAGEPVFVDFTAAWCITCQVNKLTVLSLPGVRAAFEESGVTIVTADWTNRDPVIEKALAAFGANGVPLYVFYPAGGREPVIIPQPLTAEAIISTISSK